MKMLKNTNRVFAAVFVLLISAVFAPAGAEDKSVRERAATVAAAGESVTQAVKVSYRRTGTVPKGINELIDGGYLTAYPELSHLQSDFYNSLSVIEETGGAAYYLRYSFGEPDSEDVCKVLNEKGLGLRPGSPVSATSLKESPVYPGALAFSPPPVEVVGKESFCIKINGNFEYFRRVMPVSP